MNQDMLYKKLTEITIILSSCEIKDIGLLTGLSGVNVFLCITKPKDFAKCIEENFNTIVSEINNGFDGYSYCSGISGFLWSLRFLLINNVIDKKTCDIDYQLTPFLLARLKNDLKSNQWDFLHGAIGLGIYSLKSPPSKQNLSLVKMLINELTVLKINDNYGGYKWKSIVFPDKGSSEVYNFSLAHGIASIIAFTTKTYVKGIEKEKSKNILLGAIKYLLTNKNDLNDVNCFFPTWIEENKIEKSSRLGWCYGDLGIGVVLYNAAIALNNTNLREEALVVLRHSTLRRSLKDEFILDAGLCHGTSGIGHIFYRMYWNTKEEIFHEVASFWFSKTIEICTHKEGLAGFMAFHSKDNGSYHNEYGILQGIAGIGLALHSWVTQTEPTWDECLLLS